MSIKNTLRRIIGSALKNLAPKIFVYPQVTVLSQNSLLDGRTALITGGTSGIGYSIAKAFVQACTRIFYDAGNIHASPAVVIDCNLQ